MSRQQPQAAEPLPADITDGDVEGLRAHGYSDEQIAEVVALVALQLMTGAFDLVAGIER